MVEEQGRCPACGKDTGTSRFCTNCGARVEALPSAPPQAASPKPDGPPRVDPPLAGPPEVSPPVAKAPPPVFTGPILPQPAKPGKKRTGLALALILIAVICIGGGVAAVFLLTGSSKASMKIRSPKTGATVDGNSVAVKLAVSNGNKVASVEIFGRGHVHSNFVGGLDSKEAFLNGIEFLSSKGIVAHFGTFRPEKGTPFDGHRSPNADYHWEVLDRATDIQLRHGITIEQISICLRPISAWSASE